MANECTFDFESDMESGESGSEDGNSDLELSDPDWNSDDETPLADLVPLGTLQSREAATEDAAPVTANAPSFSWSSNIRDGKIEEFRETAGPCNVMPDTAREIDFFKLIFPFTLFGLIATQTNLYAEQRQRDKGKRDVHWTTTTAKEMIAFIGLKIYMALVDLPNYKMYWSRNWLFTTPLSSIITRTRFEKLMEYLHISDSTRNPKRGEQGHDRLHHVRPVLDKVSETIGTCYTLHRDFAVDEAMVAFRGRLGFKQYMPAKPTKFGIKVWERADSTNGYVDKFEVYTGRSGNKDHAPEVGLSSRVVLSLTRDLVGSYRHLYCDNFFSSPHLFWKLLTDGIYACGTCRSNRKGLPQIPHNATKNKGDFIMKQSDQIVTTVWHDNKPVLFLSTNTDPTKLSEVRRKNKDGSDRVHLAPEVVNNYSANMNAVDRADQLRTQYSIARKSVKWWKYLFYFLVDTAITNAFILMKESPNHQMKTRGGKSKPRTQLDFRQQLCLQMIGDIRVTKKRKRHEHQDNAGNDHWPKKMKGNRCRHCSSLKIRRESSYGCSVCGVNLCVACFEPYHSQQVPVPTDEE